MKILLHIRDEISCVITGLHKDHNKELQDKFGIHEQGYFHNPRYKLGQWDGKYKFFKWTGETYLYLLPHIIPLVKTWGYDVEIKDDRVKVKMPQIQIDGSEFSHIISEWGEPVNLRDYQVRCVNSVLKTNGGIMLACTGAGKTLCSASICNAYGKQGYRSIVIVPSDNLVNQSYKDFVLWGLDVGQLSGRMKDFDHPHVIATWQTLQNYPHVLSDRDVVIVDECQGAKAKVLKELIEQYGKNAKFRFGLTGTLPKDPSDNLKIRVTLGDVRDSITAKELIDSGFLSTLKIHMLVLKERLEDEFLPSYATETSFLKKRKERLDWMANFIMGQTATNGNTLVLVSSIDVGRKLAKLIPGSHFVYGEDSTNTRSDAYALFKTEDNVIVITTVQVGGTGLSIDRVMNLFTIDISKSFIRVIQAIGRGLRKNARVGKTHCEVFDISSDTKYATDHRKDRVKMYKEAHYPHEIKEIDYLEGIQ